jgi:2-(1,2-epoxy-1,2-dihydrophenyl)acetyl-CoA isomerase
MGLQVEREDGVAIVTMTDAARMNAFDIATLDALDGCLRGLMADPAVRAVVLTGTEKVFCAGADIGAFRAALDLGEASRFVLDATARLHPMLEAMASSDTVFVAAVNGVAAGGGLGLALACDARIGTAASRFAAAYFRIGVTPDGASTWLLPRVIGVQRTRRFFMDNETMDADEALVCGLLDKIVPAGGLRAAAVELAGRWGAWSAHSRGSTKRLLNSSLQLGMQAQLEAERGLIAAAAGTQDFREGIAAFAAKRAPRFS